MNNERSTVIYEMMEKFKEGHERDAMRILHIHGGWFNDIKEFKDKVCQLYYSDEWHSPSGKQKLNRYLLASAEYMRCLEATEVAKRFLESVDEDIFGVEWY